MTKSNTIIEYNDDLILSACEFRWLKGDKFALIEAVAICAANDLQYPKWVYSQINAAMTGIFEAVYPNQNLKDRRPGVGISHLAVGSDFKNLKAEFKEALKTANKKLSLKSDTHILTTHTIAVRDFHLAELVSMLADFIVNPSPRFDVTNNLKRDLEGALGISQNEWDELEVSDSELGEVNGHLLKAQETPSLCRKASFDVIANAWETYKDFFLEDKTAKFEYDHGINLGE
jgi:hypothetical protein